MTERKIYLGDSVYIEFTGVDFILTTENGERPSNTIYLDQSIIDSMKVFADSIVKKGATTDA